MTDAELDELFNVLFVFWICPRGCRGMVQWNEAKTIATCLECQRTSQMDKEEALEGEIARLRAHIVRVREHCESLDRNWETVHNAAMTPIREALGLPDGSVPDLVGRIEDLKRAHDRLKSAKLK
jgi:hypothetical protein